MGRNTSSASSVPTRVRELHQEGESNALEEHPRNHRALLRILCDPLTRQANAFTDSP